MREMSVRADETDVRGAREWHDAGDCRGAPTGVAGGRIQTPPARG